MARNLIVFGLLLGWCVKAWAEPVSIITSLLSAAGAYTSTIIIVGNFLAAYGAAITLAAFTLYRSSRARSAARDAQAAQRAEVIANLQDRTANILQTEAPLQIVYGEPGPFGGAIVAILESGANDEFKHVVMVFAGHEMTSLDAFYFEGQKAVPDPDGWVRHGEFFIANALNTTETLVFAGSPPTAVSTYTPLLAANTVLNLQVTQGDGFIDPTFLDFTYIGGKVWQAAAAGSWPITYSAAESNSRLHITKHLGAGTDVADAFLMAACPGKWTPAHRLSGYAYAVITLDLRHARFQSFPKITASGKGKKIYDYRSGLTAYSRNNVLCAADYLRSNYGFGSSALQLNTSNMLAGANACDAAIYQAELTTPLPAQAAAQAALDLDPNYPAIGVPAETPAETSVRLLAALVTLRAATAIAPGGSTLASDALAASAFPGVDPAKHIKILLRFAKPAGGSTARFTCDGVFHTEQDRESILSQLCDSFAGQAHRAGGIWKFSLGVWSTPIKTLSADSFLAPLQINQASYSAKGRFNTARGSFIDATDLGSSKGYPTYSNATWVASDGQERPTSVSFAFTSDPIRCRNLARIEVEKSRGGLTVEGAMHLSAWHLEPGDRVWVNDVRFGFASKTFLITDWVQRAGSPITLQLLEDVESNYDLADEVVIDPAPNTVLRNPYLPLAAPLNFTVITGTDALQRQADGTIVSRAWLRWDQSTDVSVLGQGSVVPQYRSVLPGAQWSDLINLAGDATEIYFSNLTDGQQYVFRVRFKNGVGNYSEEASKVEVVLGKQEPPPPVLRAKVLEQPGGVRQYFWDYQSPAPVDLFSFEWAYTLGLEKPAFDAMLPLQAKDRDARAFESSEPFGDGVYTFAVRALDTSGIASTPVYTTGIFEEGAFGAIDFVVLAHQEGWPAEKIGCYIDGSYLNNSGTQTWADVANWGDATTWASASTWQVGPTWGGTTSSPIVYRQVIDRGTSAARALRVSGLAVGSLDVKVALSADGLSYGNFVPPSEALPSRYYKIQWTVAGSDPKLFRAQAIFYT